MTVAAQAEQAHDRSASLESCPWCGAPLADGSARCASCGVGITRPWPSDEELDRAYAGAYRPDGGRFAGPGDAVLRRTRGALARRLDRIAPPGRMLDIGAGEGVLVAALRALGREAVGLERTADSASAGVTAATLDELEGPFAAVVAWHSLEHLRAPGETLERAASLLGPQGVLLVALPNASSLQARVFGARWLATDRPRHLVHVPAPALLARLIDCGLRVERVSHWRGGQVAFGWLHGLVEAVPGTGDLYDAVRRPAARQHGPLGGVRRAATLAAGASLLPVALTASATEVAARAGGSIYVEARRGELGERPTREAPSLALRDGHRIMVVMPARNAAATLERTVRGIPRDWVDEIALVDDGSTDPTVAIARRLPVRLICHPHNVGYGGNQKTCYLHALERGADVVVMLHPDGQYEPELIPHLVTPILAEEADLVLGSRLSEAGAALAGGMPRYKYLANRALTAVENRVLGTNLSEMHTGYRAYSRRLLESVPFLRNSLDFAFDSELLLQAAHFGFRIAEVPARTRYFEEASSIGPGASIVYGLKTLGAAGRLVLHRNGVVRSRRFEP